MEVFDVLDGMEDLYDMLYYGLGIAELSIVGVVLLGTVIAAIVTAIFSIMVSLLVFLLEAIPLYKISKKLGKKSAWLVWLSWLPVIGGYFSTYVLADIPGDKPVNLVGNIKIESRLMSFWIHVGIGLFGPALVTIIIGMLNVIPLAGQVLGALTTLLYIAPTLATAWIEYAYLRDVLDIFNSNRKSNNTAAIVVAALDATVTFGLARAFYLYTVMNKEPILHDPSQTDM